MVGVELPEAAVKHVEVFVGEVLAHFVDVLLTCHLEQHIEQIRVFEVSVSDFAVIIAI